MFQSYWSAEAENVDAGDSSAVYLCHSAGMLAKKNEEK